MTKPYTTKLSANGCVLGTALWVSNGQEGWTEYVVSYRVAKSGRGGKYRGVRINGRVYAPGDQLEIVIGGSVKP